LTTSLTIHEPNSPGSLPGLLSIASKSDGIEIAPQSFRDFIVTKLPANSTPDIIITVSPPGVVDADWIDSWTGNQRTLRVRSRNVFDGSAVVSVHCAINPEKNEAILMRATNSHVPVSGGIVIWERLTDTNLASGFATLGGRNRPPATNTSYSFPLAVDIRPNINTPDIRLGAIVRPPGSNQGVTWTSNNTDVARIDPQTGWLRGITPGHATITATSLALPGTVTGTQDIIVFQPVRDVTITRHDTDPHVQVWDPTRHNLDFHPNASLQNSTFIARPVAYIPDPASFHLVHPNFWTVDQIPEAIRTYVTATVTDGYFNITRVASAGVIPPNRLRSTVTFRNIYSDAIVRFHVLVRR
jgi:hypothetical protein